MAMTITLPLTLPSSSRVRIGALKIMFKVLVQTTVRYAENNGQAPQLAGDDQVTPLKRMRYSHFWCNVVHEDLAYALGVDIHAVHEQLKHSVSDCGGKLPAEHGHGTEYTAPIESHKRWMKMDPLNVMNPGIGGLSSKFKYGRS